MRNSDLVSPYIEILSHSFETASQNKDKLSWNHDLVLQYSDLVSHSFEISVHYFEKFEIVRCYVEILFQSYLSISE